jgi:hypothetical protein
METFEEVSEAFKEFEEGVIGRAYSIGGLKSLEDRIDSANKFEEGRHAR